MINWYDEFMVRRLGQKSLIYLLLGSPAALYKDEDSAVVRRLLCLTIERTVLKHEEAARIIYRL